MGWFNQNIEWFVPVMLTIIGMVTGGGVWLYNKFVYQPSQERKKKHLILDYNVLMPILYINVESYRITKHWFSEYVLNLQNDIIKSGSILHDAKMNSKFQSLLLELNDIKQNNEHNELKPRMAEFNTRFKSFQQDIKVYLVDLEVING